jgi:hypothetical protein
MAELHKKPSAARFKEESVGWNSLKVITANASALVRAARTTNVE